MENNHNLDGGLPPDLWMNSQQQHPQNSAFPDPSTQVGQQPKSEHDFMTSRTLQTLSSGGLSTHAGLNSRRTLSPTLQPYILSSSSSLNQQHHCSNSNERSAWSHLLSLDPSMSTSASLLSGPQESSVHHLHENMQSVQNTIQDPGNGSGATAAPNNRTLPKIQTPLMSGHSTALQGDSCPQQSVINPQTNTMSQHLSQLLKLPKMGIDAMRASASETVTQSANMLSLDPTGDYSPVSPPDGEVDQVTAHHFGQKSETSAEVSQRESQISASTDCLFSPSDHSDFLNYLSESIESSPSDLTNQYCKSYSDQLSPVPISGLVQSPSDLLEDVSTESSLKLVKVDGSMESSQESPAAPTSSDSLKNDKLQTLLSKTCDSNGKPGTSVNFTEGNISNMTLPEASHEKQTKPKSTPKKSNFYGRDMSLFSVMSSSEVNDETHVSDLTVADTSDEKNVVNADDDMTLDAFSALNCDNTDVTTIVQTADIQARLKQDEVPSCSAEPVTGASDQSTSSPSLQCISAPSQACDNVVQPSSVKETEGENETVNAGPSNEDLEAESTESHDVPNNSFHSITSRNESNAFDNISITTVVNEDDAGQSGESLNILAPPSKVFLASKTERKVKAPKRGKRKISGAQTKLKNQRKIQDQAQPLDVFSDDGVTAESNETNIDNDVMEGSDLTDCDPSLNPSEAKSPRYRKRKLSKARTPHTDIQPRRTSSRKSKINAMRLIELQAESNHSGIVQPEEVFERKVTYGKKRPKLSPVRNNGEDFSELNTYDSSEENTDENDEEYTVEEEEIHSFDNEEILEQQISKKNKRKRKAGGLKISIKLAGSSVAEIVSGIEDSSDRKKRKAVKKTSMKTKNKQKTAEQPGVPESGKIPEMENKSNAMESLPEASDSKQSEKTNCGLDVTNKHLSLMEKYFSTANSAKNVQQIQKKVDLGKKITTKQKTLDKAGAKKVKSSQSLTSKSGTNKLPDQGVGMKRGSSVKFTLEPVSKRQKDNSGTERDGADSELPKFVCGYCPQRYHNKQELLSHLADHMVEMELSNDADVGSSDNGNKKVQAVSDSLAGEDSRTKSTSSVSKIHGDTVVTKNDTERAKLKSTLDHLKSAKSFQEPSKKKVECGECGLVFHSKHSLLDHVRIHTSEKPFECDICHKCFTERNLLSAHRKTHDQEKLLRCHMCSKAFVHEADLHLHMQSHPKRSNAMSSGKHILSLKKSVSKTAHESVEKAGQPPSKKPTSFASALSGEVDPHGQNSDVSVLVLKRGDISSVDVKKDNIASIKTEVNELKMSSKPAQPSVLKPDLTAVSNDHVNSSIKGPFHNTKPKDGFGLNIKSESSVESNSKIKLSKVTSSETCTCKECPDCVTRFLQSFE